MTGTTRRLILGIILVSAIALAGCGGVAEQDDALTGAAVLQATREAETARIAVESTMTVDDYSMTTEGTGVEDFARQLGSLKLKTKSQGTMPMPPNIDPPGDATATETSEDELDLSDMEFEARWFGDVTYTSGFPTTPLGGMFGSKKWFRMDLSDFSDDEDCPVTASPLGLGATPGNALDVLAANGNVLEDLGTEIVRDEETTHWRIEDPKAPPGCEEEEVGTVILELWTDADKRARRILVTFDPERKSSTTSTTTTDDWFPATRMTMTTDYFDFGVPVSVSEPPKNEVLDMNDDSFGDPEPADYGTPGPWTIAAEGTQAGTPWRVWTTTTSTGVRCYDSDHPMSSGPFATLEPDDDTPKHDGRPSVCELGGLGVLASLGGFRVLADATEAGQRTIVGVVSGDQAEVLFADGKTAPMTVDPDTHIAQWHGPAPAGAVKIKSETGTCQLGVDLSNLDESPSMDDMEKILKNGGMPCSGSNFGVTGGIPIGDSASAPITSTVPTP